MSPIKGKWYVVDRFAPEPRTPLLGPFDTKDEAENERREINIAEDCFVGQYVGPDVEEKER